MLFHYYIKQPQKADSHELNQSKKDICQKTESNNINSWYYILLFKENKIDCFPI